MIDTKYAPCLEAAARPFFLWKAGLYIRLSRDDGDKMESNPSPARGKSSRNG